MEATSDFNLAIFIGQLSIVISILVVMLIVAGLVVRSIKRELHKGLNEIKIIVTETYATGYEQFKSEIIYRTASLVEASAKVAAEKLSIEREELTAATISHIENTKLKIEDEIKAVPEITASLVRMDTEEAARPTGDAPPEVDSSLASELWDQKQHAAPNASSGAAANRE